MSKKPALASLDAATRAYFNGTQHEREWACKASCTIDTRGDLRAAYWSPQGRLVRRYVMDQAGIPLRAAQTEPEMRATAVSALWIAWKESQLGRSLAPSEVPLRSL